MKKIIKTAIYLVISILDILLVTYFIRFTVRAYDEGLLIGIQFYSRIISGVLIYIFLFVFILMLIYEYTRGINHSIWWETISLIILFAALMANIL